MMSSLHGNGSSSGDHQRPVVVVGAGPAGISATVELARAGVRSILLDENAQTGGIVFRGAIQKNWRSGHVEDKVVAGGLELQSALAEHRELIEVRVRSEVLGPVDGVSQLAILERGERFYNLDFDDLIICTGCHEWVAPFPGWTLPGVLTVGATQVVMRAGGVRPGDRVVVAGTGPLLLVAARQMHRAGAEVLGVFEAGRWFQLAKNVLSLPGQSALFREGLECFIDLYKAHIPVHFRWGIVEARGADNVLSEVVMSPHDTNWRPNLSKQRLLSADTLAVTHGFLSRSQLPMLLSLEHVIPKNGGLRPKTDEWQHSSRPRTYVAGDVAGIHGARVARHEGTLAALACLVDRGAMAAVEAATKAKPIRKEMKRLHSFRGAMDEFSSIRAGILKLATEETIICRCENVTREQIDEAVLRGVRDLTALKMVTRVGMGDCQGKTCGEYCRRSLREQLGVEDVGYLRPRFPLGPITLSSFIKGVLP